LIDEEKLGFEKAVAGQVGTYTPVYRPWGRINTFVKNQIK